MHPIFYDKPNGIDPIEKNIPEEKYLFPIC